MKPSHKKEEKDHNVIVGNIFKAATAAFFWLNSKLLLLSFHALEFF